MIKLKACVKCKGDVMVEKDTYGWYEQCLQCGRLQDLADPHQIAAQPVVSQMQAEVARAA